ncbi:MAG TPA: ATP-dependent DNA helicase UvrD2 [Acidimicrobiales bacterium]|nr:ATP-dependent DNA helicase UvrD2 [Acidimicrobiales bacterium]
MSFSGATPVGAPGDHPLLHGLDQAQREAVTNQGQPLCILAGAGSGKTRVLTRRIAYRAATGALLPSHVLALTFTRRAATELNRRLVTVGVRDRVAAGTFHATAWAQLRGLWADRHEREPALLDQKVRVLHALRPPRGSGEAALAEVAAEIEWAKARMISPDAYEAAVVAAGRRPPMDAGVLALIYARYEEEKRRRRLVDFDDLVILCAEALETDTGFAAAQRWRFRHLFVDEFQDVNPAQHRLVEAWRGGRSDLCVVGDPDQAIYAWNGADPSYLTGFGARLEGATVVNLDRNYRSSPQILAVANAMLDTRRAPGALDLRPTLGAGAVPDVATFPTDADEAAGVARALRHHHGGGRPWAEQAVLARTRAQLVIFEEALRAAGVPCRLRGAASFLARPEVVEVVAELRRRPPGSPLAAAIADVRLAARAGDPSGGDAATGGDAEMADAEMADAEMGSDAVVQSGAAGAGGAPERRASLQELVRMMGEQLALDPSAPVGGFLTWLTTALRGDNPDSSGDAVTLSTFHAAKGLEWPVVFLTGLEQGLVPVGRATTPEARAEERRLLYVAVTRAQRELHCSWAERRRFGAHTMARSPSPWLATVQAVVDALDGSASTAAAGGKWREHLDRSRAHVRSLSNGTPAGGRAGGARAGGGRGCVEVGERADPAMLAALRSWRASAARAAGVPAFVVLHDATLAVVAEARPGDRHALLALPGMGPVKAERYGEALLAVVANSGAA